MPPEPLARWLPHPRSPFCPLPSTEFVEPPHTTKKIPGYTTGFDSCYCQKSSHQNNQHTINYFNRLKPQVFFKSVPKSTVHVSLKQSRTANCSSILSTNFSKSYIQLSSYLTVKTRSLLQRPS